MANKTTKSATELNAEKAAKVKAKVDNFKERGNRRGRKALAAIQSIGVLANKKIHTWEPVQVTKLFGALQDALDQAKAAFSADARVQNEDLL